MVMLNDKWKNRIIIFGLLLFSVAIIYLLGDSIQPIYAYYRSMFGPVFWLFLLLSVVFLSSIGQILFRCYEGEPSTAGLKFVEAAGPSVGLLGTVLALMNGFGALNLSGENLDAAINGIVHTIAVSLSTTAFGLILSLLAWAFRSCVLPLLARNMRSPGQNTVPVRPVEAE
ncbi:MAG: hypothetical protein DRP47_10185 [Candidatus Zixiibacteriota bacterium]|nr:MAG: hypothetical protein DRP47_10185 [candidate division Zixibacteria bacterium]